MQNYKTEFIEFLVASGVLTFGDFVTKSGRRTPYFVNTGNYRTGQQLAQLGRFYAAALTEHWQGNFDNLYGPAYKGIPLAVTTAIALQAEQHQNVSVTYNRKEAKDHGERGSLIGHQYQGSERVVIIEDVITAGTSVRETMDILVVSGKPSVIGVLVSVDRMERGRGDLTAIEEVKKEFGFDVFSIVNVREIIAHLHNRPLNNHVHIDDVMKERMEQYLSEFGG
ncbi:MAG: orotate phosphoribosyltransferase [Sedimentisphaerales bacterium]|nr:orotate phosphoribosyltransferase [Sedimentisphaerales bacterium]